MKKIEQDIEYFVDESGNQRKEGHSKIYPDGITRTNYQVKV